MSDQTQSTNEPNQKESRIGKNPIALPAGVKVVVEGNKVAVEGPKGKLSRVVSDRMKVAVDGSHVKVSCDVIDNKSRAIHGLTRTLIANMVEGVSHGFSKSLEIVGVGYKVTLKGKDLDLAMGFSHPCIFKAPEGIEFSVEGTQKITVKGINKELVGQVAANIRKVRKPEPYKGKGIRYAGEYVAMKAGKSGKK